MTIHFNKLTEAEAERLAILAEECAETIQAIGKILRHGYESVNPKASTPANEDQETNRMMLERELGDVQHALIRCCSAGYLNLVTINKRRDNKSARILPYLHHQGPVPVMYGVQERS